MKSATERITRTTAREERPGKRGSNGARVQHAAPAPQPASTSIETRIGKVIRKRRAGQHLTLAALADGSSISAGMLSRIENGQAMPSIDALERLCSALGMSLAELFGEAEERPGTAQLIKSKDQMPVVRAGTRRGHVYKLLSYGRGPKKKFEPFLIEMDKDSEVYPRFHHPGTEFIYMLKGKMEYRFGDETYLIEPGDAFTFSGEVNHGPERLFEDKIWFISIIFYEDDQAIA